MAPPKILEKIVIFCFERRFSKWNNVIRLKSCILVWPRHWLLLSDILPCVVCCKKGHCLETISDVASPEIWGGKMFDFRQITLLCLEKRFSKHKITILSKNLGGNGPFVPPVYAYGNNWEFKSCTCACSHDPFRGGR